MKKLCTILILLIFNFLAAQIKSNYCPPIVQQLATAGNTFDCEGTVDFLGSRGKSVNTITQQGAITRYANYSGGPGGIIKTIKSSTYFYFSPDAIGFLGARQISAYNPNHGLDHVETFEYNFSQVLPPGTYTIKLWQAFSTYNYTYTAPSSSLNHTKIYDIFAIPEGRAQCRDNNPIDIDFYNTRQPIFSYYAEYNERDFTEKSFSITLNATTRGLLFTTRYAAPSYPLKNTDFYVSFGNVPGAEITIENPNPKIHHSPPAAPSAKDQSYCTGDQRSTLKVTNPDTSKYIYTWYQGVRKINEGVSLDYTQLSNPSMTSGSFTVTAADKVTGCVSRAVQVSLIEKPQPTLSISANHPVLFYGQALRLYSQPSSNSSYTLSWKGPNDFHSQDENPVIESLRSKNSGMYELVLTNASGCSLSSQVSLRVYSDVETVLGEDVVACSEGDSFTFSYPKVIGLTYHWEGPKGFSSNENRVTVTEIGVYTLTVKASDGNESVGSIRLKASDFRVEKVNTCLSQALVVPSGGRLPYVYSLDGISFQSSPIFRGDFIRAHTVYVRDGNSCEVRESVKGFRFELYGAFSPNSDGINDVWDLSDLSGCVKVRVKLFDRYGRYLHQLGRKRLNWDGSVKGKALPSGTYWYVIEFNDGVTPILKGNVTIKRRKD